MNKQQGSTQKEKCERFAGLHQQEGAFLMPNPWDLGTAKILEGLGFQAIATTSAGLALTLGKADGKVTLEEKLNHCAALAGATSIPVNADFEDGFADDPKTVAGNVLKIAETGIAGCSIEDFSRDSRTLFDFNLAVERVQAAVEATASLDIPFQLTARAENLLRGVDDLEDTIKRLQAFEAVGANVLYAPGLLSLDQLRQVSGAVALPINALATFFKGVTVDELASAGARRISTGGSLNWAAMGALLGASKEMLEQGTFNWTANIPRAKEMMELLS